MYEAEIEIEIERARMEDVKTRHSHLSRSILFQRTVILVFYTTELFQTSDGDSANPGWLRAS